MIQEYKGEEDATDTKESKEAVVASPQPDAESKVRPSYPHPGDNGINGGH